MAAASSSTVRAVQRGAGAAEPGAVAVTVVENDETVLRVAFYNVWHAAVGSGFKDS